MKARWAKRYGMMCQMIQLIFNVEKKLKKLCYMHGIHMRNMLGARMNFRYHISFKVNTLSSNRSE